MSIVFESAKARASCQTGSTLLLPIVLGRVTCKCTRFSFQLPASIKTEPHLPVCIRSHRRHGSVYNTATSSRTGRRHHGSVYNTTTASRIRTGRRGMLSEAFHLDYYYVIACMHASNSTNYYSCLMLVLSCLPLHAHAGKEEELLQRQGTATFFILGPFLCTWMLS